MSNKLHPLISTQSNHLIIIPRNGFKVDAFELNVFHYIKFEATEADYSQHFEQQTEKTSQRFLAPRFETLQDLAHNYVVLMYMKMYLYKSYLPKEGKSVKEQ